MSICRTGFSVMLNASGRQEFKKLSSVCSHIQHILLVKNSNVFSAEFVDVKCMHTYIPLSTFNYDDTVNTPFGGLSLFFVLIMAGISWKSNVIVCLLSSRGHMH